MSRLGVASHGHEVAHPPKLEDICCSGEGVLQVGLWGHIPLPTPVPTRQHNVLAPIAVSVGAMCDSSAQDALREPYRYDCGASVCTWNHKTWLGVEAIHMT